MDADLLLRNLMKACFVVWALFAETTEHTASSTEAVWLCFCSALATLKSDCHQNSGNQYPLLKKTLQFGRRTPPLTAINVQVSVGQVQICLMGAQT